MKGKKFNFIIIVTDPDKPREMNDVFRYDGQATVDVVKGLLNLLPELVKKDSKPTT